MSMKRIAITQRVTSNPDYPEIRDCLDVAWAALLNELGFVMLPVPSGMENTSGWIENVKPDGIILSGGGNITAVAPNDELAQRRNSTEKTVMAYALDQKIPVMGVCRGMQFMADYFGGTVVAVSDHVRTRHELKIEPGHKLSDALGKLSTVNSFHDYGIGKLPPDFIALATSPDGSVEAMAHASLALYGQMWHPERENNDAAVLAVIREFFE